MWEREQNWIFIWMLVLLLLLLLANIRVAYKCIQFLEWLFFYFGCFVLFTLAIALELLLCSFYLAYLLAHLVFFRHAIDFLWFTWDLDNDLFKNFVIRWLFSTLSVSNKKTIGMSNFFLSPTTFQNRVFSKQNRQRNQLNFSSPTVIGANELISRRTYFFSYQ